MRLGVVWVPYLALVFNALIWGTSWWPLREMQTSGLHPLWASAATYVLGATAVLWLRPAVWREFRQNRPLWLLALAAGSTMVGFNWGVAIGEVIRVVLLFYLMPIWAVLLARVVLQEKLTVFSGVRVFIALAGAVLVLSAEGEIGLPVPRHLGEWLGLFGGACFALNNILLRHQEARSEEARLFGMFVGGVIMPVWVAVVLGWVLGTNNSIIAWPALPGWYGGAVLVAFSGLLVAANYALQYGASRLPANVTAVVMLSEVVFATVSAIWLTEEQLTGQTVLGGMLILVAAALSTLGPSNEQPRKEPA